MALHTHLRATSLTEEKMEDIKYLVGHGISMVLKYSLKNAKF